MVKNMANDDIASVTEESARGGFFLMSGSILSTVIMSVAAIIVGRLLGPALYGEYVLALVVPSLFLLFADLGINTGITKFAASLRVRGESDRIPKIIRYGLMFQMLVGIAVFAIVFVFGEFFASMINRPGMGVYIQIVSISLLFQVVVTSANSAFVGLDKTEYVALTTDFMALAKTLSSVSLVLLGFSVTGAVLGYTSGYVVGSVISVILLFLKLLKPHFTNSGRDFVKTLRVLFSYGTPVYVAVLLVGFTPMYNQIVLTFFASNFDIGNYSVATNFFVLMAIIPGSIATALLPAFSKLDSSSAKSVRTFFRRAKKYACLFVIPIATVLMILSNQVVEIVYGSAFQLASSFLFIGCFPYFLVGIGYLTLTSLFNGLGETRTTLKITIISFLIGVTLTPVLARAYSVAGVLITSLFSNGVAMLYGSYVARAKFKIGFETWTTIKIYLIAAAAAIPPLLLMRFVHLSSIVALVACGLLFIVVYIVLVPGAKVMGSLEFEAAIQIVQKIRLLGPIAKPVLRFQQRILQIRTSQTTVRTDQP
jgi:O-antigen/teichoic acid export membrane protein